MVGNLERRKEEKTKRMMKLLARPGLNQRRASGTYVFALLNSDHPHFDSANCQIVCNRSRFHTAITEF
jgi:hypothetical protein